MDEVSIDKARPRLGDLVNDAQNGTPVLITRNGRPAAMLVPATRLGIVERDAIARARQLAAIPAGDTAVNPFEQLGRAKHLLGQLAGALERLGGPAPGEEDSHG